MNQKNKIIMYEDKNSNQWLSELSPAEFKDHQNFIQQEQQRESEIQYYLNNNYDRSDSVYEYDEPERKYTTNSKVLPRTPYTTMELIDWSRVITKDNLNPLKFSTSAFAIDFTLSKYKDVHVDRVAFESDTSWIIFKDNLYVAKDGEYHPYKRDIDGWKLHKVYQTFAVHDSYHWDFDTAMSQVPEAKNPMKPPLHKGKPLYSIQIVSNSGNLMFHRIFH